MSTSFSFYLLKYQFHKSSPLTSSRSASTSSCSFLSSTHLMINNININMRTLRSKSTSSISVRIWKHQNHPHGRQYRHQHHTPAQKYQHHHHYPGQKYQQNHHHHDNFGHKDNQDNCKAKMVQKFNQSSPFPLLHPSLGFHPIFLPPEVEHENSLHN